MPLGINYSTKKLLFEAIDVQNLEGLPDWTIPGVPCIEPFRNALDGLLNV